jgi:hypothetical protein
MQWREQTQNINSPTPGKLRRHTANYDSKNLYIFGGTSFVNLGFEISTVKKKKNC